MELASKMRNQQSDLTNWEAGGKYKNSENKLEEKCTIDHMQQLDLRIRQIGQSVQNKQRVLDQNAVTRMSDADCCNECNMERQMRNW